LKEIGKALGLTEGRISQILRDALTKLREHLKRSSLAHEDWQAFS
jgi:DNA-directed RNA polymerase sigma subunit (sigma70/sigma32)